MSSADFCMLSTALRQWLLLSELSTQISLGTTRFFHSIYLPHLSHMIPCSYWTSVCIATLSSCKTLYVVAVRQTRALPVVSLFPHPASFRFHLAMDTLAFGYSFPAIRQLRDLHPLANAHAERTKQAAHRISSVRRFVFMYVGVSFSFDGCTAEAVLPRAKCPRW